MGEILALQRELAEYRSRIDILLDDLRQTREDVDKEAGNTTRASRGEKYALEAEAALRHQLLTQELAKRDSEDLLERRMETVQQRYSHLHNEYSKVVTTSLKIPEKQYDYEESLREKLSACWAQERESLMCQIASQQRARQDDFRKIVQLQRQLKVQH